MSKKSSRRRRSTQQLVLIVLGVVLIFIFVITLFATPNTATSPVSVDDDDLANSISTAAPAEITIPTPNPDGPQLEYGEPLVQSSGMFQVTLPTGWIAERNNYEPEIPRARITSRNAARLSVIDVMLQFGVNYPSHQVLADNFFDESYFFTAWQEYDGFSETNRSVGDTVTIDFDLIAEGVNYLGRQIAWLDGDWLHMLRLIVPDNNPPLLEALSETMPQTFISYVDQRGQSYSLTAYADRSQRLLLRYQGWRFVSGGFGTPVVLEDPVSGARLAVRTVADTMLESLEAAEAYVTEELRPGVETQSAQVTTRIFATGYYVSYQDQDSDGNTIAGLVALLNDDAGTLYIAEIRVQAAETDLLSADLGAQYFSVRQVIDAFSILPPEGFRQLPSENPASFSDTFLQNVERYLERKAAEEANQ